MIFREAPTDENFDLLHMVSTGGKWELGYLKMIFGVRVRIGIVGNGWVDADLCCGPDPILRARVLFHVLKTLEGIEEKELTWQTINKLFPYPTAKPLDHDPAWRELLRLSFPAQQNTNPVTHE